MNREPNDDETIHPISEYVAKACNDLQRELQREREVKLDERGVLTFPKAPGWELHIRDFSTRYGLLDWLWHFLVSGKRWVTLDFLIDLVATIKGHDDHKAAARCEQRASKSGAE